MVRSLTPQPDAVAIEEPAVLALLREEVDLAFALTGCTSPAEVSSDLLA